MRRWFSVFSLASLLVPVFALGGNLSTEEQADVRAAIRKAGEAIVAKGAPGVAIAVVYRGETFFEFCGTDGRNRAITPHTLFEIGSNTKTFTTTLLGLDIARGRVRADDPAQDFLPDITLSSGMEGVTLGQLADFSSSLPDLPPAVRHKPAKLRGLKYFTLEDYFDFIQNWEPKGKLPADYLYSNSSVGLLGYCLVQDTTLKGIDKWSSRVSKEILRPLGMNETTAFPGAKEKKRLAVGFFANGRPAPVWPLQAWAAAGSLKSSPSDLAKYLNAYLGNAKISSPLKRGMQIATKVRYKVKQGDERFFQALAWESRLVPTHIGSKFLVVKDGGTAGFSSALAFNRDSNIGIVVLINKAQQTPVLAAERLFYDLDKLRAFTRVGGTYVSGGGAILNVGTLNTGTYHSTGATLTSNISGSSGTLALGTGTVDFTDLGSVTTIGAGGTLRGTLLIQIPKTVVISGDALTFDGLTGTITPLNTLIFSAGGSLDLNGTLYDLTGKTLKIGNGAILLDDVNLGAFPPVPPEVPAE